MNRNYDLLNINPLDLPAGESPGDIIIFSRSIDRNPPLYERMLEGLISEEPLQVSSKRRRKIRAMVR